MNVPFNSQQVTQGVPMQQQVVGPQLQQPSAPTFYPWPGSQVGFQNLQTQNLPQFQSLQQQKPMGLPGKLVATQADITPNDVPMDGRVSFFPQQDYSCIIAKAWNAEGKIDTVVYVPQKPQSEEEVQNGSDQPSIQDVLNRLKNLEDVIVGLPKTPGEESLKSLLDPLYSKLDTISGQVTALENKPAPSSLILK